MLFYGIGLVWHGVCQGPNDSRTGRGLLWPIEYLRRNTTISQTEIGVSVNVHYPDSVTPTPNKTPPPEAVLARNANATVTLDYT